MLNFHEKKYLRLYPDVARAVRNGLFKSGEAHWRKIGRLEDREVDWYTDWIEVSQQKIEIPDRRFTFIMPCFNNLKFTQQAVRSIRRDNVDFVFIDNGSTDSTFQYLNSIPNSKVIHNTNNLYVNAAWNQGFREVLKTDTDYVCLCNNDIIAGSNWLQPIRYLFETRNNEFYFPASNNRLDSAFEELSEMDHYVRSQNKLKIQFQEDYFIGFCFFFRLEHIKLFYPLPSTLKIIHGDDYIVDILAKHNIVPAKVNQCAAYHHLKTTQNIVPEIKNIIQQDEMAWQQILEGEYKRKGIIPQNRQKYLNIDPPLKADSCLLL